MLPLSPLRLVQIQRVSVLPSSILTFPYRIRFLDPVFFCILYQSVICHNSGTIPCVSVHIEFRDKMILTVLGSICLFCAFPLRVFCQTNDPEDLSFIKKWAAIGDSYAAGIGAGNVVDRGCSRYDSSYPNLVNVQLGQDTSSIDFTFIACSGAKIPAIIDQANSLSGGQQMITVSAGGNDASLMDALNDCVFTFKGLFGGNCDQTLSKIQTFIDSSAFASSIDSLITAAKSKLAPGGTM